MCGPVINAPARRFKRRTTQETNEMDFRAFLRGQMQFTHNTLEQVIADVDNETLHHRPAGSTTNAICAIYAHAVTAEDGILNGLVMGRMPIFNADWAAKTGVPLKQSPQLEDAWAASIKMNLPAFREYAAKVYESTDKILAEMDDAYAETLIDTPFGGGKQPRQEFVANLGPTHMWGHMGEIAAIKGARGMKGLPF
jgi:hypothetical protein